MGISSSKLSGYESAWRKKRWTVEKCAIIDVHTLSCHKEFQVGHKGTLRFTSVPFLQSVDYTVQPGGNGDATFCLSYNLNGESVSQQVELHCVTSKINFKYVLYKGKHWHAHCPLCERQAYNGRMKLWKLYLPPGEKLFGCIHCHNLTWQGKHNGKKT